jgi:gamma-glutamylcysteine synthetase
MSTDIFQFMFNNTSTSNHSKRIKLDSNFFYKVCVKSDSVKLQLNNNRITISHNNFQRIQFCSTCINACIIEKSN